MDDSVSHVLLERTLAWINRVVAKFKQGLEGGEWKDEVSDEEAVNLSKDISSLCPLYGPKLYLFYERLYGTYYKHSVLPCVKNKQGEEMLRELCHRWNNHQHMVSYLAKFFGGLQKFVPELSFTSDEVCLASQVLSKRKRAGKYKASLEEVAMVTFRDQVLIASEATTALIKMITDQRDGVGIDQKLLSRVCDLYVLSGLGSEEVYEMNFESYFLYETQSYYSGKASSWIADDSFPDYLLKVEKSLKNEKERVAPYLHSSTEPKLVDVVHKALLVSVQDQLLEKENSGCRSFLSKDQKDNLSRIFRVYRAFPKRLKTFADFFKLHITEEMNSLIEQAEHALNSGRSVKDEVLFREIADLHDKYMEYVRDCFHYRSRFHNAFKEAFATLGGSLIAERLATFCDNKAGVNDLPNLYKIYDTASLSLEPVAEAFKRHVTAQVKACIQKAIDALSSGGSVEDEVLVREIGDLHDKYIEHVRDYFQYHRLFHSAFKKAFEICCKMTLGGSSIAERLATFCDSKAGVNDLPKVYKIYDTASLSLEPVAEAFELHVTARVKACIQKAKDAEALVKEIIKLHGEHMDYVGKFLENHSLFLNALKDAFKIFCNEEVDGGSSSAVTYCENLLKKAEMDDISTVYTLYHVISKGLEPVAKSFELHVTAQGNSLIKQTVDGITSGCSVKEKQVLVIRDLIDLHDKYMVYVTGWVHDLTLFHKAFNDAFRLLCSKTVGGSSMPELLAIFCDDLLKKARNGKSNDDSTIESTIDTVVKLLDFIDDRDVFAEFHRKKLAGRLLVDRNVSDESIITKLKGRFGSSLTYKMENMVLDMELVKERQLGFKAYMGDAGMLDLSVNVLNKGFWPGFKTSSVNLPCEMSQCIGAFSAYFGTITRGRKLEWIYSEGTCLVKGTFYSGPIDLIVTTLQAIVLCAFNSTETLSYQELIEQVKLSKEDLISVLHSLSCSKYVILKKEPASKTIAETDAFQFNSEFTSTSRRIRVSVPSLPLPPACEREKVAQDVDRDRRYVIDASLTRIMKSRKVLPHQQLISECVEQLSRTFKPDRAMIKKRIEDLIIRDYLVRDTEDPNKYKYVA